MLTEFSVPQKYENLYTDTIEGYLLVYNPISEKGITVLNQIGRYYFKLADGKKTINDIFKKTKRKYPYVKITNIFHVYNFLVSQKIVSFKDFNNQNKPPSRKRSVLNVWLHITNECNLRCTYCYIEKTSEYMKMPLAKKAIRKVINNAKDYGFETVNFKFSGGEALLKLPLILILINFTRKYAKDRNIKVKFLILTNGILITEKIAGKLKENDIRISVSLDGLEKYHNLQRVFADGKGSFKLVEKGIRNLQKVGASFSVSVVITSNNLENIPELTKYLLKNNIRFNFSFYRENPNVKESFEGDDKKLIKYLKKAYKIIYENVPKRRIIDSILDRVSFSRPHLQVCAMGKSYIVIRYDGKIASCQMTQKNPIGSIDDKDLIKTMREGNFIRPKSLTVKDKIPCKNCQWKHVCCGGCPLLTFSQKGRYDTSSPYCEVYKALIPEALRIEAKRLIKFG